MNTTDPEKALTNPECTQCNIKFAKASYFDMHMKNVHEETDYMRIIRLSNTVKDVLQPEPVEPKSMQKSLDCSECGI